MELEVPFLSNTEDDTHCVQASLGMILKYFKPESNHSMEELEQITAKEENLWTWPLAMLLWLTQNNYDVKVIDLFDYEEFAEKGAKYIYENLGEEIGSAQEQNSDLPAEQARAKQLIGKVDKKNEIPTQDDVRTFLEQGYVPLCRVNMATLNGVEGYMGHSIIVKGFDNEGLIINDPGLPPQEDRHVSTEAFEQAWAYPVPESKNITAVKLAS
jgi:hypothetical protein